MVYRARQAPQGPLAVSPLTSRSGATPGAWRPRRARTTEDHRTRRTAEDTGTRRSRTSSTEDSSRTSGTEDGSRASGTEDSGGQDPEERSGAAPARTWSTEGVSTAEASSLAGACGACVRDASQRPSGFRFGRWDSGSAGLDCVCVCRTWCHRASWVCGHDLYNSSWHPLFPESTPEKPLEVAALRPRTQADPEASHGPLRGALLARHGLFFDDISLLAHAEQLEADHHGVLHHELLQRVAGHRRGPLPRAHGAEPRGVRVARAELRTGRRRSRRRRA